jgi:glutathione synthase
LQHRNISVGFVLEPVSKLNTKKDSSLAMILAAQARDWRVYYIEQLAMSLCEDKIIASAQTLEVNLDQESWYALGESEDKDLAELDVIFMRKDPPFDINYIYSTYFLERLEQQGVLIVNKPGSLRDCNEKLFATNFPQCCPPLIVSADQTRLKEFHQQYHDVIYKPLDGMGGSSIFRARPQEHNLSVILETLTVHGTQPIMAQRYLPEILSGDKRILLIDGEPVPFCLARVPAQGETRGNLAAGGRGLVQELTARDRWIVEQVADDLRERGLIFVGLDVIGDYLTEINVTSPTCIREIDREAGTDIGGLLMDAVAKLLEK